MKATIAVIATGADIAEGALARVSANVFTVKVRTGSRLAGKTIKEIGMGLLTVLRQSEKLFKSVRQPLEDNR